MRLWLVSKKACNTMIRLNKMTDYAILIMAELVIVPDEVLTSHDLAQLTHLEQPTVAKVLKRLSAAGLVNSIRGMHGGYSFSSSQDISSVADVIAAMDGPIGMTECSIHTGKCAQESVCSMRSHWRVISRVIEDALDAVKLTDLKNTSAGTPVLTPIQLQQRVK